MIRTLRLALAAGLAAVAVPAPAELMIAPTRVVLTPGQRSAELILVNKGEAIAAFRIAIENRRMKEDGSLETADDARPGELFAADKIRATPRQLVLKPGERQTLRISASDLAGLAPGDGVGRLAQDAEGDELRPELVAQADGHRAFALDPIQIQLLTTTAGNVILNCHRQWGKTTFTALRALYQALAQPNQLIVVISPSLDQSKILTKRCRDFARALGLTVTTDGTNPRSVRFPNGSLILPIAADADHVRGWSANLLIIDEAAYVADQV